MALSESIASNQTAPQDPSQDIQTLISLLGDMVPLLLRMQSPAMGQGSPALPADLIMNPMLDHQAAVSFVENIAADSLHTLSNYLEARIAQNKELEVCKPILAQAVNAFAVHDYAHTFNLIWQAYRLITALRSVNPQLPSLRSEGAAKTAANSSSSTQH